MILSNIPVAIDPDVDVLEVGLRPEVVPPGGRRPPEWTQLYRLQDLVGLPTLGGDAVHFFGPDRAGVDRLPFVLAYDAGGAWRYLLVRESPDHPWAVDRAPAATGVRVEFADPARRDAAAALLGRLISPAGLSEADCWDLIRSLRQGSAVVPVDGPEGAA